MMRVINVYDLWGVVVGTMIVGVGLNHYMRDSADWHAFALVVVGCGIMFTKRIVALIRATRWGSKNTSEEPLP